MISVIITAAGKGLRMKNEIPKQYLKIRGIPILSRSIGIFENIPGVKEIITVVPKGDMDFCGKEILSYVNTKNIVKIVEGGEKRQDSVYNGLLNVTYKTGITLIHDGVRPFAAPEDIKKCIKKAEQFKAAILAVPVSDTLKKIRDDNIIEKTVKRDRIWQALTPQAFEYSLILSAYKKAYKEGFTDTDDSSKIERLGADVFIVEGSRSNIKITTPEDIKFAEAMADRKDHE